MSSEAESSAIRSPAAVLPSLLTRLCSTALSDVTALDGVTELAGLHTSHCTQNTWQPHDALVASLHAAHHTARDR